MELISDGDLRCQDACLRKWLFCFYTKPITFQALADGGNTVTPFGETVEEEQEVYYRDRIFDTVIHLDTKNSEPAEEVVRGDGVFSHIKGCGGSRDAFQSSDSRDSTSSGLASFRDRSAPLNFRFWVIPSDSKWMTRDSENQVADDDGRVSPLLAKVAVPPSPSLAALKAFDSALFATARGVLCLVTAQEYIFPI
ncbi:unnamed protein product [Orchesella dallaii]|uniref:Uncharacterized protein n=1 Tax=Orchesella dallaii TaxID=48710 RepID=A0ABP1S2U7_9HEXA